MDTEFLRKLDDSDIVSISELHTETKDVFIPGYKLLKNRIRTKTHKGPKIGGGLAVFIKDDLIDSAHVVPNNNDNSIWIKLQRKILKVRISILVHTM